MVGGRGGQFEFFFQKIEITRSLSKRKVNITFLILPNTVVVKFTNFSKFSNYWKLFQLENYNFEIVKQEKKLATFSVRLTTVAKFINS